jgi:hypothetical protein
MGSFFIQSRTWRCMARRTLLALLLCATMLSGCTGIESSDWGEDGIEVEWNGPDKPVQIKSAFGNNSLMSNLTAIGCNETGKMPTKDDLNSDTYEPAMPVVLSGWVSAVHHYQNGAGMYENSISRAVSTAVVIEAISPIESYDAAVENYESGVMGTRVQVKDWGDPNDDGQARPFAPDTAGKPKLEMNEEETDFHAAGLIPASADVLEGMEAINWHKPVKITGYMLHSSSGSVSPYDYYYTKSSESVVKTIGDCELLRTGVDGFRGNILVMTIETPDDRITLNEGYSSSVGGLNTWFFTILVLIIGGGGAFGLFIFSTLMQRHGAASAAKVLLGEGGLAAARQVMAEAKEVRKEGLDETHTSIAKKQEKTKKDEVEDVSIKGFSLDSILATESSSVGPAEAEGGGVQLTVEADEIAHKMETGEYDVGEESVVFEEESTPRSFSISGGSSSQDSSEGGFVGGSGRVVSSQVESEPKRHFSSSQASINEPSSTPTRKTIKTRKTRQSSPPQEQQERAPSGDGPPKKKRGPPPKRRQSVADDDGDFSDFSF